MKTIQIILAMICCNAFVSNAQLMNTGFENLNADGSIQYWGFTRLEAVIIDSNGVAHYDSIVIDQKYCQSSTDAHSGNRALEIRNAFNYTQNQGISGGALSSNDTMQSPYTSFVPIVSRPLALSFYYKYLPVGNDTAYVYIQALDANSNEIGYAEQWIPGTASSYTLMNIPVNYSSSDSAALVFIQFKASYNDSTAHFGTRFLIDDLFLQAPNSTRDFSAVNHVSIYPNPVNDLLFIQAASPVKAISIRSMTAQQVYDHQGAVTSIDCSKFENGIYFVRIETDKGVQTRRLNIQH